MVTVLVNTLLTLIGFYIGWRIAEKIDKCIEAKAEKIREYERLDGK